MLFRLLLLRVLLWQISSSISTSFLEIVMNRPFRALLLAAGLGTRLRPITLHQPKCLVQIGNEPLLGRWLRQLNTLVVKQC